ncbi:MAG TPA: protein kinase [Streptosporangiaceae bacterium]|nr:protein kinase [Streptosporangiaceae bacterium]
MSRKIAGYRLGERLGQGSAGAVYLARDERLHYQVAVKVLGPDPARDLADTLIHEVRTAAALEHPHIIPVFDAGDEDGTAYIVMRYARGGDARSLLRRRGALPLAHAWRIIAQVASALDAAHAQGLVHRDVKPANILFDAADTVAGRRPGPGGDRVPAHAYLSDFGVGRVFPPGLVTGAEQLTDALDYLAPEQIEGEVLDGRADLYALACTSFELLCGVPPFGAEQGLTLMYSHLYAPPPVAAARRAGLPAAVDPVLARALAKDPAGRYPSCGRFAAELRAALGLGSVLRAGPAPSPGQTRPGPARVTAAPPAPAQPKPGQTKPHPAQPHPAQPHPAQPHTAQPWSAQYTPTQPNPAEPGRRAPASLTGASMLLAPAPGEFTPAPLSRAVTPAAAPAGDWPAETADWSEPGPEPGAHPPATAPPASPPPARRGLTSLAALRPAMAAAAVLVVIIGVVAAFALSRHQAPGHAAGTPASPRTSPTAPPSSPSSPSSSPPPASRQAAALDTLLISSSTARTALHRAVKQVAGCVNLAGAIGDLQDVVNQRSTDYSRAMALMVSALPDGAKVKSKLTTALSLSLKADQDYLTWARQQRASGCTPTSQSGSYNAAFSASQQADAAKEAFVQAWNPVATRFGLAQNSARDI